MDLEKELKKYKNQHDDLMKQFDIIKTNIIRLEGVMSFLNIKIKEEKKNE